jgi:hypothetical protein
MGNSNLRRFSIAPNFRFVGQLCKFYEACTSDTAAILFSLIATCQRHKVEPFAYLRDVLTRIAATPVSPLDQFLLDRWQAPQPDSTN